MSIQFTALPSSTFGDKDGPANFTTEQTQTDCAEDRIPTRRQSIKESLGIFGCIIIVAGSILILIIMAFLIYLWGGNGPVSGGKKASLVWRSIMLKGWVTQAVTLSSVIIRIALALQASVCTSLVAALILENYGVPLSKVAHFTVLRSVNGGPFTLVYLMSSIRSMTLPGVAIWVLFLGTLASQFTSTILVSDLDFRSLVDFTHSRNVSFMISESALANFADQFNWGEAPNYVPFGEIPATQTAAPNTLGVSDTGVLRRAWLPFDSNITTLRSYAGPGWVVDSRVSCLRPPIEPIFKINPRDINAFDGTQFISGTIDYDQVYQQATPGLLPPACAGNQCLPASFNCSIPAFVDPLRVLPNFLCVPSIGNSTLDDQSNSTIQQSPISESSIVMMVLTSDGAESDWNSISNSTGNFTSSGVGEWTVFQMSQNFTFNMTLCFLTQSSSVADIRLDINVDPKEPVTQWDIENQTVDTGNIRNFLGVDNSSDNLQKRGLFTIEEVDIPSSSNSNQNINTTLAEINTVAFFDDLTGNIISSNDNGDETGNQTFFLCYDCDGFHNIFPSIEYRMIFQDTLTYTQRPALAIQAFFGVAAQMLFYERSVWFDTFSEAQVATSVTQRAPQRQSGLIAVMVITAVNIMCIIFITIWFLAKARYTKLGNYWQAIAQVSASSNTKWILDKADGLTDVEVGRLLIGKDPKIRVGRSAETGQVEILESVPSPRTHASSTGRVTWRESSGWKGLRRSRSARRTFEQE
jgi:hypothetical protein